MQCELRYSEKQCPHEPFPCLCCRTQSAPLFLFSVRFSISQALNSKSSLAKCLVLFPDGRDTGALIHLCADLNVLVPVLFSQNPGSEYRSGSQHKNLEASAVRNFFSDKGNVLKSGEWWMRD